MTAKPEPVCDCPTCPCADVVERCGAICPDCRAGTRCRELNALPNPFRAGERVAPLDLELREDGMRIQRPGPDGPLETRRA